MAARHNAAEKGRYSNAARREKHKHYVNAADCDRIHDYSFTGNGNPASAKQWWNWPLHRFTKPVPQSP